MFDDPAAFLGGVMMGFLAIFIIIILAIYIYMAVALMAIAKKLKVENGWLAFIPIANFYLLAKLADVPWWTMFGFLLLAIPLIGGVAFAALNAYWWWNIAGRLKRENWLGILMVIPIVNFILIGIFAWGSQPKSSKR